MTKEDITNTFNFFCTSNCWEVLSEFPNYALSINGDVFSINHDRYMKIQGKVGAERVSLRKNGKTITKYIAQMLEEEFGIKE